MWECKQCKSTAKPSPVPGLRNRRMVTVAEFCSDKCRDEYLDKPQVRKLDCDGDTAIDILEGIYAWLKTAQNCGIELDARTVALFRRLKQYELKPSRE